MQRTPVTCRRTFPVSCFGGGTVSREDFGRGIATGGHLDTVEALTAGSSCDLAYMATRYEATNSGVKVAGRNILITGRIGGG
jgi:hypothetical protein